MVYADISQLYAYMETTFNDMGAAFTEQGLNFTETFAPAPQPSNSVWPGILAGISTFTAMVGGIEWGTGLSNVINESPC